MILTTRPRALSLAVDCGVVAGTLARTVCGAASVPLHVPVTATLPAPVALVVPASPVPVRAAGRTTLVYELHVADSGSRPLRLDRLDVRDADRLDASPVATYGRPELERDTKLIAPRGAPPPNALTRGVRAVIYIWI